MRDDNEAKARDLHAAFLDRWGIVDQPLHSSEICSRNESFLWLRDLEVVERDRFLEELYQLMRNAPVMGIA